MSRRRSSRSAQLALGLLALGLFALGLLALGLLGAIGLLEACAPLREPAAGEAAPRSAAITGGAPSEADPAVGALIARRGRCEAEAGLPLCTGTLIAPRVVLLAAHCFDRPGRFELFFGADLRAPEAGSFRQVSEVAIHPSLDLALARLAEAAPVAPVAPPSVDLDATFVGGAARIVGFGETRDEAQPIGVRRTGEAVITAVDAESFELGPMPAMSCAGDSGGPVFVAIGGEERLVGVTSGGDPACAERALNVRAAIAYEGFVAPFLAATEAAPVGWPEGFPEDRLCLSPCTSDAECPFGMACEGAAPGSAGRCALPSLVPGDLGEACASDAECGGGGAACARVRPEGEGACRCSRPCSSVPPLPEDAGVGGGSASCAAAPGARAGGDRGPLFALLALALWALVLGLALRARAGTRADR